MTDQELLDQLLDRRVGLVTQGSRLLITAPRGSISPETIYLQEGR